LDSVKNGLERSTAVGSKEFGLSVLDQIQQFMCTAPTHNDVTTLVLARDGRAAGS
jgi:hypothetical protein